jgi:hypothetical protein
MSRNHTAFVAGNLHAEFSLDCLPSDAGRLHSQSQCLIRLVAMNMQAQIVHEKGKLDERTDSCNPKQARTEGKPELIGGRGAASHNASGGMDGDRHRCLVLEPPWPVMGHQTGGQEVQRILGLAGSLDEMSVRDVLEGLLQVQHDVDAVGRCAPQDRPYLVSPGGVADPATGGVGAHVALSMCGSPRGRQGRAGPAV